MSDFTSPGRGVFGSGTVACKLTEFSRTVLRAAVAGLRPFPGPVRHHRRVRAVMLEPLESRHLLAADVVINEIYFDPPNPEIPSEFIELYNPGQETVDLSDWRFTDGIDYTFAAATTIGPGQYVAIAEDLEGYGTEFGRIRGRDVIAYQVEEGTRGNHTFEGSLGMDFVVNEPIRVTELGVFQSSRNTLRLTIDAQLWSRDDGGSPRIFSDDSGIAVVASQQFTPEDEGPLVGASRFKTLDEPVVLPPGAYTMVAFGYGLRERSLNGQGAPAGSVDSGDGLLSFVGSSRFGEAGSFPETVDDGPANQYAAGTFRYESVQPLPDFAQPVGTWLGKLANDGERIVLRNAAGETVDQVDYRVGFPWPTSAQGEGPSMELVQPGTDNDLGGSWRSSVALPTPGLPNSRRMDNPGPTIRQVEHQPQEPASGQAVQVTAKVTDPDGVSQVVLEYQLVDPGSYIRRSDDAFQADWVSLVMRDDGTGGDEVAGDGVFTVVLPASLQTHRRLVRYRFTTSDSHGVLVAAPYDDDPQPNFAYFVYDGIPAWTGADRPGRTPSVTYDAEVMNSLPAYHLIARESDVADSQYNQRFNGVRFEGTLVYRGVVYDHIEFNNRGQFSTYVSGKNKWKLHFHRGHEFEVLDDYGRPWKTKVRKLNLGTAASPWARPNRGLAGMDEALAFKFFNLAGVPASNISAFQLRVVDDAAEASPDSQYDGDLWGLYLAFEDPGGRFLEEHELPAGNLFRMQSGNVEMRHHGIGLPDDLSDVRDFVSSRNGYNKQRPVQPVDWWQQNVDLDGYYSYRAVIEAINHTDLRDQENSMLYFNPDTSQWSQFPWDVDLLYEEFDRWGPAGVQTTTPYEQFRKALEHEEINIQFQARLREMQDLFFNSDQAWQAVEEYARYVEPFAAVDRAMWDYHRRTSSIHRGYFYRSPASYHGGAAGLVRRELTSPDFDGMTNWVKEFIAPGGFGGDQTIVLYEDADIPERPTITYIGDAEFPINGLRLQTSAFRDPQGEGTFGALEWRIGEITDAMAPAYDPQAPIHYEVTTVWESGELDRFGDSITVDAAGLQVGHAYRARVRMKDDTGRWSHWSEPLEFVATEAVSDNVHRVRISELNYNPHDALTHLGELNVDNDQFEFVELLNTGSQPVDLDAVRLVQRDVDGQPHGLHFVFDSQTLEVNERVVVVRNRAAFQSRYGTSVRIASGSAGAGLSEGEYLGGLSNRGERITLIDARGGVIMTLAYDDKGWPDRADGGGSTLEIIDPLGAPDDPGNWRNSSQFGGSPGTEGLRDDRSLVINEVLARTELPDIDQIELYNTTDAAIDLYHWYLSDTNDDYFRYQFIESTSIAAGGYLTVNQKQLGFGLNGSRGDDVWLIEAGLDSHPVRFVDHVEFGETLPGISLGRWPNTDGPLRPMAEPTLGGPNAGPIRGDANSDGRFDRLDLVLALAGGQFLSGHSATFAEGDWNGDGIFDQLDIVAVLAEGRYADRAL